MESLIISCVKCESKNRIDLRKQHLAPCCGKCGEALDLTEKILPVELGDTTMDTFIKSTELPVLVDFYSPTCGPCQSLAPLLVKVSNEFFGKIIVAKVNTAQNPGCSAFYKIKGVPTLIFFRKGNILEEVVGLIDGNQLREKMKYYSN